jgi:hypothetical protein
VTISEVFVKFRKKNLSEDIESIYSHSAEFVISATVTANSEYNIDTLVKQVKQTNFILVILFI